MKEVDYAKLSQQYAGFLVAAGGVSITALTIVLGLRIKPDFPTATEQAARLFMVAALIVGIVSSFAGAHMLAETAAFFSYLQEKPPRKRARYQLEKGQRLFVLATSHIFITIGLVLFAIVLLPTASGIADSDAVLKPISFAVFPGILLGALVWMAISANERATVKGVGRWIIGPLFLAAFAAIPTCIYLSNQHLPRVLFIAIALFIAASVVHFALTFRSRRVIIGKSWLRWEIAVFSSAITFSYVCLVCAYLKIQWFGSYR